MESINKEKLDTFLSLLETQLREVGGSPLTLVVCGGSALIAAGLVNRTTKDVDIVAFRNADRVLIDPEPLPPELLKAVKSVAATCNLPDDWLNTGPVELFRMGLPDGFSRRLSERRYGQFLTVCFIGRLDQIHFKLYAAVDRGGYHIEDLLALEPTVEDLIRAGRWSCTHDVSEGYRMLLRELLCKLGYADAADGI